MSRSQKIGAILALLVVLLVAGGITVARRMRIQAYFEKLPVLSLDQGSAGYRKLLAEVKSRLEREPTKGSHWGELGYALHSNGETGKSAACFARAEELEPGNPAWPHLYALTQLSQDRAQAKSAFLRAISAHRVRFGRISDFSSVGALVEALIADGEFQEARKVLDDSKIPLGINAHRDFLEAHIRSELGDLDGAIQAAESSVKLAPRRADVHQMLAQLYGRKNDTKKAERERQILELLKTDGVRPPWPDQYRERASAYTRNIADSASYIQALSRLGRTGEAFTYVTSLPREEQQHPMIRAAHAMALTLEGDYSGAEAQLQQEGPSPEEEAIIAFARGTLALAQKDFEKARSAFSETIAKSPKMDSAHFNRGLCHVRLNKLNEALADFEAAIQANPQNLDARLNSAKVLYDLDNKAEAKRRFEQLLLVFPQDDELKELVKLCDQAAIKKS
jgi:tetratricopeptide (TPR) repeat protein